MSRLLRYQISDWTQITECLSNNSKSLYLTLSKYLDGNKFRGLVIRVNHVNYDVLFAATIKGTGCIVTEADEEGVGIPFLTTEEILTQLKKFGFYVTYDVKSNLPNTTLNLLVTIDNLGFDKVSKVVLVKKPDRFSITKEEVVVAFKTVPENEDLLTYGCKVPESAFNTKLQKNIIMNLTNEPDIQWDWLTYMANISDILDENVDPTNDFETYTGVEGYDNINNNDAPITSVYPVKMNSQGFYSHEDELLEEGE